MARDRLLERVAVDDLSPTTTIDSIYRSIADVLEAARGSARRAVNQAMVHAYWQVGRIIVEEEQAGSSRAEFGVALIPALAQRLTTEFGKGFSENNLWYMRQFYQAFPILHALRGELSWTHYRLLLKVEKDQARGFYNYLLKYFVLIDLKIGVPGQVKMHHSGGSGISFFLKGPPMGRPPVFHLPCSTTL